jgi:uncharacterized protein YllA (UPF0747 family)
VIAQFTIRIKIKLKNISIIILHINNVEENKIKKEIKNGMDHTMKNFSDVMKTILMKL